MIFVAGAQEGNDPGFGKERRDSLIHREWLIAVGHSLLRTSKFWDMVCFTRDRKQLEGHCNLPRDLHGLWLVPPKSGRIDTPKSSESQTL